MTSSPFLRQAIDLATKDPRPHKVGAVIVKNGQVIAAAHGGQVSECHHAEGGALALAGSADLRGATVYTTLEPCTRRRHPEKCCAVLLKERGISKVVIGVLDPNPNITNSGRLFFRKHGIQVEMAASDDMAAIIAMMGTWYEEQTRKIDYAKLFVMIRATVSERIAEFPGPAVGNCLNLCLSPDIQRGWMPHEALCLHTTTQFELPPALRSGYQVYRDQNYDRLRLSNDTLKIMLRTIPGAYSDRLDLHLETMECRYSEVHYYQDTMAPYPPLAQPVIQSIGARTSPVQVPNALCAHYIIVTSDRKILMTRRAPDLAWHPNKWSVSIEEQLKSSDFAAGRARVVETWLQRGILEELSVTTDCYRTGNVRLLSLFLESDVLNFGLCVIVSLNLTASELSRVIRTVPRIDTEFTAWDYLDYSDDELIREILTPAPSLEYHPSSPYRMLMSLLHLNGLPYGTIPHCAS